MNRRRFLRGARWPRAQQHWAPRGWPRCSRRASRALADTKLQTVKSPLTTTGEQLTSFEDITHYNNFYEFGVDKDQPAKNAGGLPTRPWTVSVEGKVEAAEDLRH